MHPDTIVTIGRQFGAGGLEIGRLLAEALGVPFYDRELLAHAAKASGLSETLFEHHDEKPADAPFFGRATLVIHDCCGTNSGWFARPFPSRRKPAMGDSPRSSGRTVPFSSTPSSSATSFGSE